MERAARACIAPHSVGPAKALLLRLVFQILANDHAKQSGDSHAFSVYADDVDGDNTVEILVAGHTDAQIPNRWAELRSYYYEP